MDIEKIIECKNNCKKLVMKEFAKGEEITSYIEKRRQIFILLSRRSKLNKI